MENLNLQVAAVLMPLEIKCHTATHLKALKRSIELKVDIGMAVLSLVQHCYEKCDFTS